MNPHLSHLLSCVFDGLLAPEHRADLAKSGLTDATIAAQLIRTVPPSMIARLLGFDLPAVRSALLLPFRSSAGGFTDLVRVKIFPPLTDTQGHAIKYLQPKGSAPRLYFVRDCLARVRDGDEPLYLLEGEKKAAAIAQLGVPVVGFCGVEGWHVRSTRALLPDFDALRLTGRVVKIVPDGDVRTNPDVARAIQAFGIALRARGADPRLVHVPAERRSP